MNQLDNFTNSFSLDNFRLQIHFKENSIPSIHAGYITDESRQQIRELCQSILLEYKDTHLGHEGVKILNELHERFSKL